jgi:outer membrane protein assembly factor BamB
MKKYPFLFFLALIISCKSEEDAIYDSNGVATKLPHIWNTSISEDNGLILVSLEANIQDSDGNVLVSAGSSGNISSNQPNRKLIKLNSGNGKKIWEWDDRQAILTNNAIKDAIFITPKDYVKNENKLFFTYSTSSYCLDINNGKTLWKTKVLISRFGACNGLGNKYFSFGSERTFSGDNTNNLGDYIYEGSLLDGNIVKNVVKPSYIYEQSPPPLPQFGYIKSCMPYIFQKDTLLNILFIDPVIIGPKYRTLAGLYNYSQKKWIYERKVLSQPNEHSNITRSIIVGDKFYHASGRSLHSNDVMTGESIWSQFFEQGFGSSGFIIENNKLYAACEDRFLYCLDTNTGQVLWKEQNTGTCSPLSYLNGVLYYLGGGDGKLHAVDADTGKHLWKLTSPDVTKNSGAFFYGLCATVPGKNGQKGRVIGTTGLNAYCYEAVR